MKMYIADAFTDQLFKGNPAAVCFISKWPRKELMMKIAKENRFSETAFAIKKGDHEYDLRWFTPAAEIDLCGHATLATAFIIFREMTPQESSTITFHTQQSGDLLVTKNDDRYEMVFPSYELKKIEVTPEMTEAFGAQPTEAYLGRDLLAVFDDPQTVINMDPDQDKLVKLPGSLQNVTARGTKYDCVSRSFAPKVGVPEDPVCGSGHCHIIPYWAEKLGQKKLTAYQVSERGGVLYCEYEGKQTKLAGNAVLYSKGELNVSEDD